MAFTTKMREVVHSEDVQYENLFIHEDEIVHIAVEKLREDPNQPRKRIDPDKQRELRASVEEMGVLQPILVRPNPEGWRKDTSGHTIIAGARRYQASLAAGLSTVPCIVKDVSEKDARMLQLVENLQRDDLTQEEEAEAFMALVDDFQLPVREIARRTSKDAGNISKLINVYRDPTLKSAVTVDKLPLHVVAALLALPVDDRPDWIKTIKKERKNGTNKSPRQVTEAINEALGKNKTVLVDVNGPQTWPAPETPTLSIEAAQGTVPAMDYTATHQPPRDFRHIIQPSAQTPEFLPEIVVTAVAVQLEKVPAALHGARMSAAFVAGVERDLVRIEAAVRAIRGELY